MIWKILGLFVETLTDDEKYSVLSRDNLLQNFQMQISQKQKIFPEFSLSFINLDSILNILNEKTTLIAYVFLKLGTRKKHG